MSQLGRLPHLRHIVVRFPVDDADLAPLARMTELQALILDDFNPGLTDRTLALIGRLWRLERLTLGDTSMTDAGLAQLAHLGRLEDLDIGDAPVTDAGLAHLAHLDRLETFYLGDSSRAKDLGVGRIAITGSGFEALGRLPKFRVLMFGSPILSGPGLAGIGRLTSMEAMTLIRYGDDPSTRPRIGDLRALTSMDHLADLWIEGFGGDWPGQAHLKGIKNLSKFTAIGLGDEAVPTLLNVPSLRVLSFQKHHLTARGLAALRANPQFEVVVVDREPAAPPAESPP